LACIANAAAVRQRAVPKIEAHSTGRRLIHNAFDYAGRRWAFIEMANTA